MLKTLYRAKKGTTPNPYLSRLYVDVPRQSWNNLTGDGDIYEPFQHGSPAPQSPKRFFGNSKYSVYIEKASEGIDLTVRINKLKNAEFLSFHKNGGQKVIRRISFNTASMLIREKGEYIIEILDQSSKLLETFDIFIEI